MKEMKKKNRETGLEIAVIGMSGRFPGAKNIDQFWDNLKNGVESIHFFTDEELEHASVPPELIKNPNYVKASGRLQDKELFDAVFFDYSPREAELMDPQLRFFHECCLETLENAGYDPESYNGLIGVYAGASSSFYWEAHAILSGKNAEMGDFAASHLTNKDFLSPRISYKLNLKGPAISLYTTCSTSLVSIHLACRALLTGECQIALAGGVTINQGNNTGYLYQEGMIASPDGHIRAFDAKASGTVFGNGIGIVALKRLKYAIADRDHIYAVIKGSAVNNDGIRKVGFTAPSVKGQAEVIKIAQRTARVDPQSITYIETHGTGTVLGDLIEIEALKKAFDTDKKGFCRIGSIKTNVGHLDSAAGVTGFIKTVLALKHRAIPPSLNCETPNREFDLENSPFVVNTKLSQWKNDKYPLRAGVSSFGIGGTNAHVILEEAPKVHRDGIAASPQKTRLIVLSAKTEAALERNTHNLAEYLSHNPEVNFADAAYTLQVGRKAFPHRRITVVPDVQAAIDTLTTPGSEHVHTFTSREESPSVIFMFPGQGSQYVNMGLELYQKEPVFQAAVDQCFEILEPIMDDDLKNILYPGLHTPPLRAASDGAPFARSSQKGSDINQTLITQPLIFIFEYALAQLLIEWGIRPNAMIGHSIGEYVAAHLSGVFSLEDALKLVAARGKLMQKMHPGAMISVSCSEMKLRPLLTDELSLAAVNTPNLCVVSGPYEAIDAFAEKMKDNGYESKRLHTSHAFHSRMMEPILKEFEENVKKIKLNRPQIPFISNVNGRWMTGEEAAKPAYWANHLRKTVRFEDGVKELLKTENPVFVELGPGKVLSTFVRQHPDRKTWQKVLNLVRHPREDVSDIDYFLNKTGLMWLYGIGIDWKGFNAREERNRIPLPTYSFDHRYFQINGNPFTMAAEQVTNSVSLSKNPEISDWFYIPSWELSMISSYDNDKPPLQRGVLMFTDQYGFGRQLLKRPEVENHEAVIVTKGTEFKKVKENAYTINPGEESDYHQLIHELSQKETIPRKVIHLWSVTKNTAFDKEFRINEIKHALDSGFYSLVSLAKAIGNRNINHESIDIYVISNHIHPVTGEEDLSPAKAAILGACRIIPQEFPNINCTNIDIDYPQTSITKDQMIIEQILSELSGQPQDPIIAYRGKQRWTQSFKHVPLKETGDKISYLRDNGVYLITGGPGIHGTIGFILAKYLAQAVKAKIIFASRTELPPKEEWDRWLENNEKDNPISKRIHQIQELETLGSEVLALPADVSDIKQLKNAIHHGEKRFGKINGVIHAAGIMGKELFNLIINDTGKSSCEGQFIPKIYGLTTLYEGLKDKELDFCLLTSSLASFMGPYAAYSAANNFMDTFVHLINRDKIKKWVSVNWDNWHRPGSKTPDSKALALTPTEGMEALHRILSWGKASQVLVSTVDPKKRLDHLSTKIDERNKSLENSFIKRKPHISDWFYTPTWNQADLTANKMENDVTQTEWLVFIDESSLSTQLVQCLKKNHQTVVTVGIGSTFAVLSEEEYFVNPQDGNDYLKLFKELEKTGKIPGKIVHLWGITGKDHVKLTLENLDRTQDLGLYSLINIAQAIGNNSITRDIQLGIITSNMQPVTGEEELCPEKATVLGPIKIIPLEYSNITCRNIDIIYPASNKKEDEIIDNLLEEFTTDFSQNSLITYRENHRWVQSYKPEKPQKTQKTPRRLKEKGVYLVTGGMGGMGFTLAEHLAKTVKAMLILTDISYFPSREKWDAWLEYNDKNNNICKKIRKIREMEKYGAEVLIYQADVSLFEQMKEVIADSEKRFGKINGVVHTAGLIDYAGVIQNRTREMTENLLAAKVKGTLVLDSILENRELDFIILFSSTGNIFYKIKFGQVGYNAGHEFLDVFPYQKQKEGIFTVTVDWGDWSEVGMTVEAAFKKNGANAQLSNPQNPGLMSPAEGTEVFNLVLEFDFPRIAVTTQDLITQLRYMNFSKNEDLRPFKLSGTLSERPELTTAYIAPRNPFEQTLADIWQKFFGYDKVGIRDDFFELGGDSLKAITVTNKVHKDLDVRVPLAEFFKRPTIEKYAEYIATLAEKNVYTPIEPAEKKDFYPLSSAQKRMYILNQLETQSTNYNITQLLQLEGKLNKEKFEHTFRRLIKRHESIRTSFEIIGEEPMQKIHESDDVEFRIKYYDPKPEEAKVGNDNNPLKEAIDQIIRNFVKPFDLSRMPLLRVGLIKTGENKHIFIVDMHHVITDGISMEIFTKEFMALFRKEELAALKLHYKDYSEWQNSEKEKEKIKKQEEYWLKEFAGEIPVLSMPTDYTRPSPRTFEGEAIRFSLNRQETASLKQISKKADATLFMTLFSLYTIFLAKLCNQQDIVAGTVTAGRRHEDIQQIIGMFINMLPIRNYPEGAKTFRGYLEEVRERTLHAFDNQYYLFEDLVEKIAVERDVSRNPVFDVMFVLQNMDIPEMEIPGLKMSPYGYGKRTVQVDLKLQGVEVGDILSFFISYSRSLFKKETIKRFVNYFKAIVSSILEDPGRKISEIEILTKDEKRLILHNFNNTKAEYPQNITVHQLFEKQAEQTPDNIAAAEPGIHSISYKELNEKANRLAWKLKKKGVRTNYILGLMVLRSVEMLIGILAILKSGGAYLPLDSSYPEKRIKYMLEDSQTSFLLTCGELLRKCKDMSIDGEKIDICEADFHEGDKRNSEISAAPHDPVYLIYTSGSTGNPKGVIIEHKNVINFFEGITSRIEFKEGKTIVALTTISFDIFVLETLLPLTRGVKVLIANENLQNDPRLLLELTWKNEVNMLQLTPSRLQLLISCEKNLESLKSVEELMVGGEAFPGELFQQLKEKFKGKIFNMYGPAETTVWSTLQDLTGMGGITIGTPITNTQVYILDSHNHPQPVGLAGELCIGGEGAGRGYVNRPELAAEKFIDNPFIAGKRVYRTGDLAKWTSKGNLEFLGRIDYQEKIRGFRVEFGEIESQLLKHTEIKEAVVTARKDEHGDNYLCAYIVSTVELDVSGLRDYLSDYLPDYMIPGYFVRLNQIPLTSNGKINRKALPEPLIETTGKYEPPRNEVEEKLAKIWSRMLKVDKIGINDDFFEIGGNSMSIIRFASEINKEFGVELPVIKIFRDAKIKEISKYIINEKIIEEEPYMLLNHSTAKRLFCFPPLLGYGFTYKDFANLFADWSIYGFNFLEEKNRVEKYVELIKGIQKSGPYVLFGWSSGGNLAFEVAKELERQGNSVSDLIFLDSDKRTKKLKENQNFQEAVEKDLERLGLEILKKRVLKKTGKFRRYYVNLINRGKVDANIHFIFAEDTPANKAGEGWEQSTNNAFFTYRGAGSHDEFLKRGGLLEKNVEIIKKILYSAGTKNLNQK